MPIPRRFLSYLTGAMANCLRKTMSHPHEVRTLLCALYKTEADLLPDLEAQTLTIRLHHLANVMSDNVIEKLCTQLNATETRFPRTNLRMVFKVGSIKNPRCVGI